MDALLKDLLKQHCDRDGCPNEGTKRCSGCKTVYYCSENCQKSAWAAHKKGCQINAMLNKFNDEHAARLAADTTKPSKKKCTGCGVKFDEEYYIDEGPCPDCGYVACESCSCHNSRGSCYCEKSNFGHKYCEREPQYYHISSRTGRLYKGDYHPDTTTSEIDHETHPELFEKEPRECNNCGEVKYCLLKSAMR
ncbi:hypothetical protein EXIGLDRAFT_653423 [Exidia glandulosa HHB12029]|uniref:MYND-type domain-containing protein n=1 Tax=Exidia glandulosa HHB12029 TaxID=1314781 RepID=A0A165E788_EXIGL|nr:hypothetical protein EXIGLDRAFT_653423 [Exidia glandulosa HHB12029]